jgi:hypothetical protein
LYLTYFVEKEIADKQALEAQKPKGYSFIRFFRNPCFVDEAAKKQAADKAAADEKLRKGI